MAIKPLPRIDYSNDGSLPLEKDVAQLGKAMTPEEIAEFKEKTKAYYNSTRNKITEIIHHKGTHGEAGSAHYAKVGNTKERKAF